MHTWQHAVVVGLPLVVARVVPLLPLIGRRLPDVVVLRGRKLHPRAWIAAVAGVVAAFLPVVGLFRPGADPVVTALTGLVEGLAAAGLYSAGAKIVPGLGRRPEPEGE